MDDFLLLDFILYKSRLSAGGIMLKPVSVSKFGEAFIGYLNNSGSTDQTEESNFNATVHDICLGWVY